MQVLVFSGRELFMADASVFVDDAEAYEVYERDEESEANKQTVKKRCSLPDNTLYLVGVMAVLCMVWYPKCPTQAAVLPVVADLEFWDIVSWS
jgi:hypothetical protein